MISIRNFIAITAIAGVVVPLATIWYPELRYYQVTAPSLEPRTARAALSGLDAHACSRDTKNTLSVIAGATAKEMDAATAGLRESMLVLPGQAPIRFHAEFSSDDFLAGDSSAQLASASLVVPDVMLFAWRQTSDLAYLRQARTYINGWWRVEQSAWLPRGLQWNDHAVAARAFVLTRYLCAARSLPGFDEAEATEVLRMIATTGERLTRPTYYTAKTNHGVMQNLALMDIAASFPELPRSPQFRDIGAGRFAEQLDVYVSPEGAINEHSVGYQELGVDLLRIALACYEALGIPAPPDLAPRYTKAVALYETLKRPDGTLPLWGDTVRGESNSSPEHPPGGTLAEERRSDWWGYASGLAVWWSGGQTNDESAAAQTLVTWANFATEAHKHADEMAMFVWTRRSDILIGSGYWPYDGANGNDAAGWAGANAPHFSGEKSGVRGVTRLLGAASSKWVELADMERVTSTGKRLRRQVVHLRPNIWIAIDQATSPQSDSFTVDWMFDPMLKLDASSENTVRVQGADGTVATVSLSGCRGGGWQIVSGSKTPFAGWTAPAGHIVAAPTIVRQCPANEMAVLAMIAKEGSSMLAAPIDSLAVEVRSADQWQVRTSANPELLLSREGQQIRVARSICAADCEPVEILDTASSEAAKQKIDRAFGDLSKKYIRYQESWLEYRFKMTFVLFGLWCGFLALLVGGALLQRKYSYAVLCVSVAGIAFWLVAAAWFGWVYFA